MCSYCHVPCPVPCSQLPVDCPSTLPSPPCCPLAAIVPQVSTASCSACPRTEYLCNVFAALFAQLYLSVCVCDCFQFELFALANTLSHTHTHTPFSHATGRIFIWRAAKSFSLNLCNLLWQQLHCICLAVAATLKQRYLLAIFIIKHEVPTRCRLPLPSCLPLCLLASSSDSSSA